MTSCQNICKVEECPGREKRPWRCNSIRQVLQRTERSTYWCHSSIQVVWVQVQQSLTQWPTLSVTHVLASTQVGLLPACNPAQYNIRWATSKDDKVEKTLLGLFSFVSKYEDVFLGSCHSLFLCHAAWLSALPQTLHKHHASEGLGTTGDGKNPQEYGFTSLWHTHAHSLQWWQGGSTSPRPEQHSLLNFDPSHYLPRRWGLGWGDNLWTLTSNPEAWAGPCQDNLMSICANVMEEKRQQWGFRGKKTLRNRTWSSIFGLLDKTSPFMLTYSLVWLLFSLHHYNNKTLLSSNFHSTHITSVGEWTSKTNITEIFPGLKQELNTECVY